MVNKIEITVTGKNEMPATFDAVKAQAAILGSASGSDAGGKFSSTFTGALGQAIPPAIKDQLGPKIQDPIKDSGKASGAAFTSAFSGQLASGLSSTGVFGGSIGDAIGKQGDPAGKKFGATFSQSAKDSITASNIAGILNPAGPVGTPMIDNAKKTGDQVGKDAGNAAAQGMSPLIIGAIGGAAAIGAPLLLAGLGVAFVGITALALKSNKTIAADYVQLGKTAEGAITQAAAPLAGDMHQAVTGLEGDLKTLQPQLDTLFANVGPDITVVAAGVNGLVSGMLPGLSSALGNSQVIVKDFGAAMGPLGTSVGSFFTGLTRDSATTGAGLQSVFGVLGNTVGTLGSVLGSASSAASADLMAIDPVINTVLTAIRGLSSPATIGGLAGVFGAMKLDPGIQSGLQSASNSLLGVATKAEGASGLMGKLAPVAEKASGAFGTMADVMGGPWGIAIGAGVGMLSGLAGMMFQSSQASDALTVSQQNLAQAIAQDGGQVGQSTVAYIAQQVATDGLAKSAADAGISLATYTQAIVGNKDAQASVTAAVATANQVILNQNVATDTAKTSTGKFSDEQKDAQTAADGSAAANNRLTTQNQQLTASVAAINKQVTDAITKQAQLTQAANTLNSVQTVFNATLAAGYQTMVANSDATGMNTLAALNLGTSSYGLNQQLYQSVDAYDQAQTQGNAYLTVLTSMSGTINTLLGTEAAFTTSLFNMDKVIDKSGASLDVNTEAGAKNITTLTGIATAADKAAGAVYDNEVTTKGAGKAYDDANTKLAQEKQAFIDAADKANLNKGAVQQLANELFKLPSNVQVGVGVNTGSATYGLAQLLNRINTSSGTVTIYENTVGQVGSTNTKVKAQATGGVSSFAADGGPRSGMTLVGEYGPELVKMPGGSQVMPASNTAAMLAGAGAHGGRSSGPLELTVAGGTDGAVATMFMQLIRTGKIQIKQKAIVP